MFYPKMNVKISPAFIREAKAIWPSITPEMTFLVRRRGKENFSLGEMKDKAPIHWLLPEEGISIRGMDGKREIRPDIDEALERANNTYSIHSAPLFYYNLATALFREIGMEGKDYPIPQREGGISEGICGVYEHKSHPLTVLVSSTYDWEEQNFWVGATLDRGRVEQFMRESSTKSLFSFFLNPPKSGGNYFPLEVFESSVTFDTPRSVLDTAEGWNQLIGHLRKVCS